jgi:glycosyltransferase involved in cell wall biosynthesis
MKDITILWISAMPYATTGYGRMCKQIVSQLISTNWDITVLGGQGGVTVWGSKMDYPVTVKEKTIQIPTIPTVGQIAGQDMIHSVIDKYNIDLVITHWDCFAIEFTTKLDIPCINYVPVDAPFTRSMYNNVRDAYKIVAFAKYGYNELLKWFPTEKLDYIPHGINVDEWKPLTEEECSKGREKYQLDDDTFVICGNAANIGERKQLPLMIKVFKRFHDKYPNSRLHLFTNPTVAYPKGYDLRAYANAIGIVDDVFFPRYDPIIEPFSKEELREFYGISDLYLTATLGEGFGLPILEAQACGVPVVGPNCSTIPELVEGHGWIYDVCDNYEFTPVWIPTLQTYPAPDMNKMLEALIDAKTHPAFRELNAEKSRAFALRYDWKKVMPLWERLLTQAENKIKDTVQL